MNASLSFRKESIQDASSQSESLGHSLAALAQGQGPRQAHEQRNIITTTHLTITTLG